MWDYLSIRLIRLTVFVVVISIIARDVDFILDISWEIFMVLVLLIGVRCILFFRSVDLFPFFFFFETSLVPTAVLILG